MIEKYKKENANDDCPEPPKCIGEDETQKPSDETKDKRGKEDDGAREATKPAK